MLDGQSLEAYQDNKVALLSGIEQEILSLLLDTDKQKKASLGNLGYVFTQLHQARRLESGQSTQNLLLHEIVEAVERDLAKERAKELDKGTGENERESKNV